MVNRTVVGGNQIPMLRHTLPLTRTSILFVLPTENALSPVSVCADSVAMFHSSICNNFMC